VLRVLIDEHREVQKRAEIAKIADAALVRCPAESLDKGSKSRAGRCTLRTRAGSDPTRKGVDRSGRHRGVIALPQHTPLAADQEIQRSVQDHWPVLQWPGPAGQRPSVIAERAGISKQAVNQVLRDLERLGYVELRADPRDSRARLVELTARGDALVEATFSAATAAERELESGLTPDQRTELKKTLTALWRRDVFGASLAADTADS
jgi:DNA-binding MarR family transcriptional regulator